MKPSEKPHYVNNKQFSQAVCDYVNEATIAKKAGDPLPTIPNYIAECFLKIAEGLSYKSNFIAYTYREEMVMDAVENSLKAIYNYDIEAATRTGLPNAFSYFTQISYYAFLRRIAKEKKQQDIKHRIISKGDFDDFLVLEQQDLDSNESQTGFFVDQLRSRINTVKAKDVVIKKLKKQDDIESKQSLEMFLCEV
jgi:hypothetical protein